MKIYKFILAILSLGWIFFGCSQGNPPIEDPDGETPPAVVTKYLLSLRVVNPSEGRIDDVSGYYNFGERVTLIAYPAEGYMFDSWHDTSGFQSISQNPYTIVINKDINIDVHFILIPEADHFEYQIVNEEVWIRKYVNSSFLDDGNVIIPASIEGYPVTTILAQSFALASIHSVTFPNTVTTIEPKAFYLSDVREVFFSNSITYIGTEAFFGNRFTQIVLPNSLLEIGVSAFTGNLLEEIYLPISVIKIGEGAFGNHFPQTITTQHMKKPSGWKDNWKNINATVIWSETEHDLVSQELIFFPNGDDTLSVVSYYGAIYEIVNLVIPSFHKGKEVTKIGKSAFQNSIGLKSVLMPNSIIEIDDRAFYGCHQLTSVILSSNLLSLGDQVFYGCLNLPFIIIPYSVVSLGNSVFSYDSSLLTIYSEATNQPMDWSLNWKYEGIPVYWNDQWYLDESGTPHSNE
ncbi:MAG: leucine-rich repeat protein [Acholeplasmatales bacterium]|jgi:hypothetical protein|nr:leucine-rich repeat protein [Acholeplasmatales bacterium]